jgi:hypothetical protein
VKTTSVMHTYEDGSKEVLWPLAAGLCYV